MRFSIETYSPRRLEGMVALYNAETAFEPHITPLEAETFEALVAAKSYFDPNGLFVAVEKDEVVGWVHACVSGGTEPYHAPDLRAAHIRMLLYTRERLDIGAALVRAATAWLKRSGLPELGAMHNKHGYPFYRGLWLGGEPMGAPVLPHVQLALEVGGYKLSEESVFMVAELTTPPPEAQAASPLDYRAFPAAMEREAMRESWIGFEPMVVSAIADGAEVGRIGWVVLPQVAARLGSPCVNIWTLGVREEHRRKGIATALVSRALRRGYELGARFASVGTQLSNAPAQGTYAKLGFAPYRVLVGRTLSLDAAEEADGEAG